MPRMLSTRLFHDDTEALRARLDGALVRPDDPGWDAARQAWNLVADQRPAMVVVPRSAADVQAVVTFARDRGLRVAMQGTGHNATPLGDLGETILVKTHEMRGVSIDREMRIARVEAGALWIDVTAPASELGLAPLAGSSPDVGVVGYTLGGGLSWLGRRYGLASERVIAMDVVTADGRLVRADRHQESELFWALRGGGGSFAAVVAMELELIPLEQVYAGMLLWPAERAAEVLHAWREWTASAPDRVTTSARIMHLPPLPALPGFLRGRSVVVVDGAYVGEEGDAEDALAPLRALAPEVDTFAMVPPVALSRIHMDPETPMPGLSDAALLDALPPEVIDELVALNGAGSGTPLLLVELRHLGGARARGTGPTLGLLGEYHLFAVGVPMVPELIPAIEAQLALTTAAVSRHGSGRHFSSFAERPTDPVDFYGEDVYAVLREIKAQVDPYDVFRGNHHIAPAT